MTKRRGFRYLIKNERGTNGCCNTGRIWSFSDFRETMMKSLKAISDEEKDYAYSKKQSLISDFFEKRISFVT